MSPFLYSFYLMFKLSSSSLFTEMSTSYFLYFSWVELKVLYRCTLYKPVSFRWFEKASCLLRSGSYSYTRKRLVFFDKLHFKRLSFHNKIIENAIFNIINPFFHFYFLKRHFELFSSALYSLILIFTL